jgi:hypothetical protein
MESIYLTPIVALAGAVSTLLAVAIASRTQIANQRLSNEFQLGLSREKSRIDRLSKSSDAVTAHLASAHKLLSQISREFSITGLNVMWTASMPVDEFNSKYMSLCEKADELRMIVNFYAPDALGICEEIYGQMGIFRGNFANVLYLTESGKKVDHNTSCFQKAHEAAIEIGEKAAFAKNRLRDCFELHCAVD